jgi:flagellar basal body rod protein FlgG
MPTNFTAVNGAVVKKLDSVVLNWIDNSSNATGFTIQRATNSLFTQGLTTTYTATGLALNTQYWFRLRANNGTIIYTAWMNATPFPITTLP